MSDRVEGVGGVEAVGRPDELAPVAPPRALMVAAAAAVGVGVVLLSFTPSIGVQVAGYLASSFVPIVLLAAYQRVDLGRRHQPGYRGDPWARRVGPVVAAAGVLVAAVHVWRFATELAG